MDVAVTFAGGYGIYFGQDDGRFESLTPFATTESIEHFEVGDFDGDSDIDIAGFNEFLNRITVFTNNGSGDFSTGQINDFPISNAIRDYQDSFPDIAVTNFDSDFVSVLSNNADGTFSLPINYAGFNTPLGMATRDIDGDLDFDIVVAERNRDSVSVVINECIRIGDINLDGSVNLLDVDSFVTRLINSEFQFEADINRDGEVNLLDVLFVELLAGA